MPDDFIRPPNNRAILLANVTCPYCGIRRSDDAPFEDEHVVGRRFVPKGALANSMNLIVQACRACNGEKSDLEDEISAVTLQPAIGDPHRDPVLSSEAARKAGGSYSRQTRKLVADSYENQTLSGTLMGAMSFQFGMTAPPQLMQERTHRLAVMHLQAFFYLMSFDETNREGGFIPGQIGHVASANKPDWGNPLMRGFADLVRQWPLKMSIVCASEFFKLIIRREPADAALWSFGLEWNANHRLIGFFGDMQLAQTYVDRLPELPWKRFDASHRYRMETAIDPADDILFAAPDLDI